MCSVSQCQTGDGFGNFLFVSSRSKPSNGFYEFPAGLYRLYILADGLPMSVQLTLDELSGQSRLPVSGSDGIVVKSVDMQVTAPTGSYSAGATRIKTPKERGLLFSFLAGFSEHFTGMVYGECVNGEASQVPEPASFSPVCAAEDLLLDWGSPAAGYRFPGTASAGQPDGFSILRMGQVTRHGSGQLHFYAYIASPGVLDETIANVAFIPW